MKIQQVYIMFHYEIANKLSHNVKLREVYWKSVNIECGIFCTQCHFNGTPILSVPCAQMPPTSAKFSKCIRHSHFARNTYQIGCSLQLEKIALESMCMCVCTMWCTHRMHQTLSSISRKKKWNALANDSSISAPRRIYDISSSNLCQTCNHVNEKTNALYMLQSE